MPSNHEIRQPPASLPAFGIKTRLLASFGFVALSWITFSAPSAIERRPPSFDDTQYGGVVPRLAAVDSLPSHQDFESGSAAQFHAHGEQVCASGCALSRHPTPRLSKQRYIELITQLTSQRLDADSLAFETLLYFGRQTNRWMDRLGTFELADDKVAKLRYELQRTHARIALRLIDEQGEIRSWLPATRVPLDRRHVFTMETERLQPLVTSGTVKRVGLDHLWTRL